VAHPENATDESTNVIVIPIEFARDMRKLLLIASQLPVAIYLSLAGTTTEWTTLVNLLSRLELQVDSRCFGRTLMMCGSARVYVHLVSFAAKPRSMEI
jgi:hypothetical protein